MTLHSIYAFCVCSNRVNSCTKLIRPSFPPPLFSSFYPSPTPAPSFGTELHPKYQPTNIKLTHAAVKICSMISSLTQLPFPLASPSPNLHASFTVKAVATA